MEFARAVGPPSAELRPLPPTHGDFPVYADLPESLADAELSLTPEQLLPHLLSVVAGYSYASDLSTLAAVMTRMGLEGCRCYAVNETVEAMLINANACLVQSPDGRAVILAFRGTPPTSAITWLIDIDTTPHNIVLRSLQGSSGPAGQHQVHAGFYRNTRAIRYAVLEALLRALRAESVIPDGGSVAHPMEALYVTGHSLGGAMACIFALMLRADPAYGPVAEALRATCTFGQPMVASPALAAEVAATDAVGRFARYVYRRDPVPHLPPSWSGDFAHFGIEYRFTRNWHASHSVTGQSTNPLDMLQLPGTALARRTALRRFPLPGLNADDHNPQNYVTALTPPDRPNEFGDDRFSP